jgi:hypothetical protein
MENYNNSEFLSERISPLRKFFVLNSGAVLDTYFKAKKSDQQRKFGLGLFVTIVALVSATVSSLAWSVPFGPAGLLVGPGWLCLMLFLERVVLQQIETQSMHAMVNKWLKKHPELAEKTSSGFEVFLKKFGLIAFRLCMIVGISYFSTEMMRVLMFKPEIVREIQFRQNKESQRVADSILLQRKVAQTKFEAKEKSVATAQNTYGSLIADFDTRIAALGDSITAWRTKLPYEVNGEKGGISGQKGDGPHAKAIRETIQGFTDAQTALIEQENAAKTGSAQFNAIGISQKEVDRARTELKDELATLDRRQAELIERIKARPENGLMFMLSVLKDLSTKNPVVVAVFWLFILIESAPVLLKSMAKDDSYIAAGAIEIFEDLKDSLEISQGIAKKIKIIETQF